MKQRLRYGPAVSEASAVAEHPGAQRPVALVLLLAAGVMSLPIAAYFSDDEGNENWILPLALGGAALVGALVGGLLPGLAGRHATRVRGMWVGALVAVGMLLLGTVVFFLLISG
jgi:hypothetical protein